MAKKAKRVEKDEPMFLFWILLSILLSAWFVFVFTIVFNLFSYAFHYNLVLYIILSLLCFFGVSIMLGIQISSRTAGELAKACLFCIFVLVCCIAVFPLIGGDFPKALLPENAYIEYKAYDKFKKLEDNKIFNLTQQRKWAEEATIQEQIDKKFQEFMKEN